MNYLKTDHHIFQFILIIHSTEDKEKTLINILLTFFIL